MSNQETLDRVTCARCGGPAFYWPDAIVPGDPMAPRGRRRGVAHRQPAWACVACGHVQPEERRVVRSAERHGA